MSSTVFCLLIDSEKSPVSTLYLVDVGQHVADLKRDALKETPQEGVGPGDLRVWRCKDRNAVFNDSDEELLEAQIKEGFSNRNFEVLSPRKVMADLQLSEQETIFLEILGILYAM